MGNTLANRIENLIDLASLYGWNFETYDLKKRAVKFKKSDIRLVFFPDKAIVMTSLIHPRKGQTRLLRKGVDMDTFEDILFNPRVHTKPHLVKSKIIKWWYRFDI